MLLISSSCLSARITWLPRNACMRCHEPCKDMHHTKLPLYRYYFARWQCWKKLHLLIYRDSPGMVGLFLILATAKDRPSRKSRMRSARLSKLSRREICVEQSIPFPFHKRLKYECEQRGWSQEYLAGKVVSDPKTVGRWESGERQPQAHIAEGWLNSWH